jgi:ribosomal protein S27E
MARSRGGTQREEAHIRVRCPNPDCEAVYEVAAQHAGKRARCAECGAVTIIPTPRATASENTPAPRSRLRSPPPAPAKPSVPAKPTKRPRAESKRPAAPGREVRIGCIGRGHAGKTALFQVLGDSLVGDFLPSGLHLDAADPREVARMIHESEDAQRLLRKSGLPPTLEVSQTRYCVYEGDKRRVVCHMREVIGQVLTHTLPNSEPTLQARYVDYIKNLVNANVLWVVVPCPPADPRPNDRRRYANDLRITMAYLREALRLRTLGQPAAVALVLTKADALFANADEARAALTDDVLHRALGPLVQLIEQSASVSDAAIIPTTAFGFGKAVLHPDATERHEAPGSADEPFGDEPIWLLKEGESPQPYNLDTLFLWSLLLGIMNQGTPDPKLDKICRMLRDDLEAGDPWLVPLKGGVALEAG